VSFGQFLDAFGEEPKETGREGGRGQAKKKCHYIVINPTERLTMQHYIVDNPIGGMTMQRYVVNNPTGG
jgi:hypothetical protein